MIAQWDSSLSVLSVAVAVVLIAQWVNECISLSVLSVIRVYIPAVAVDNLRDFYLAEHNLWTSRRKAC